MDQRQHDPRAWALRCQRAEAGDRSVLVALAEHVGSQDGPWVVWPSATTLASITGRTKRHVQKALDRLVAAGVIEAADASYVEHIRADRRPVPWTLCPLPEERLRGEQRSPRAGVRGEQGSPRRGEQRSPRTDHEVNSVRPDGVKSVRARGEQSSPEETREDPRGEERRVAEVGLDAEGPPLQVIRTLGDRIARERLPDHVDAMNRAINADLMRDPNYPADRLLPTNED